MQKLIYFSGFAGGICEAKTKIMDIFIQKDLAEREVVKHYATEGKNNFFLILMLGILNTITPFSIDMYLPAFPNIAKDLHSTVEDVSLSVSTYFLGFALGQILYGPLLDRFGRKPPLYIGLVLYIIATLSCTFCHTIHALMIMRFFQALGGCVASVAAIAFVQDLFPPHRGASIISFLVLVIGLSPLLAPSVGSFVADAWGWQAVFYVLAGITVIMLFIAYFFLPSGAAPDVSVSLLPEQILRGFQSILVTPRFYIFALAGTFSFAGLFIYVAGSPAVFMNYFHLSARQYGGVFALISVGFIGGSQLNHILTKKYSGDAIFTATLIVQAISSLLFAACVWLGLLSLAGHLIFLFIILSCVGIGGPNATAMAMAPFSKAAGSASALLGFIQIGIGGIVSSAVGLLHIPGSLPLALSIAAASVVALVIFLSGRKRIQTSSKSL